ncbi:hypothetical protein AYK61_26295 [Rhodococcus sp. SBT000017]|jgi:hypothetical protein|nr:hypothetical protein AYK61_26295 [Rhodococcus sp. SBT000017]
MLPRPPATRPLTEILDDRATDTTSISLLTFISDHLLDFAMTTTETLTIVIAFREPDLCTADMARTLQHLARKHPYVKALGAPRALFTATDGVRHADLVQPSKESVPSPLSANGSTAPWSLAPSTPTLQRRRRINGATSSPSIQPRSALLHTG